MKQSVHSVGAKHPGLRQPLCRQPVALLALAMLSACAFAPASIAEQRDIALYLTAAQARHHAITGLVHFVDLRPEADFSDASIPGARRMEPSHVRAATVAQGSSIILVDEGWGSPATERVCRRLRDAGREAHILWGSVGAWAAGGGEIAGPQSLRHQSATLTPQAALSQWHRPDWRVVDLSGSLPGPNGSIRLLPVPPGANAHALYTTLGDGLARETMPVRLLLVDHDHAAPPWILDVARAAGAETVFTVEGGVVAIERETEFTHRMRQSTRRTVTTTGHGSLTLVVEGGCAPCP